MQDELTGLGVVSYPTTNPHLHITGSVNWDVRRGPVHDEGRWSLSITSGDLAYSLHLLSGVVVRLPFAVAREVADELTGFDLNRPIRDIARDKEWDRAALRAVERVASWWDITDAEYENALSSGGGVMPKQWPIDQTLLWDGTWRLCHGYIDGLPVFSFRTRPCAPPEGLGTYRQLQALGKRPGGTDPVALLRFRHRQPFRREELAPLWRIDLAVPKRHASPAQRAAIDKALVARRTCPTCPAQQQIKDYYVPISLGQCWDCAMPDESIADVTA